MPPGTSLVLVVMLVLVVRNRAQTVDKRDEDQ